MSDPVTRLNAALEGRYAIERELGEGGMAPGGTRRVGCATPVVSAHSPFTERADDCGLDAGGSSTCAMEES